MKNQLCFTLKVRGGARTPIEVSCDMLCANNDSINLHGNEVTAASISLLVVNTLNLEIGRLQDAKVGGGSVSTNKQSTPLPESCVHCKHFKQCGAQYATIACLTMLKFR